MCFFFEHGRTLFERVALESRYLSDVSLNLIERDFDERLGMFSGMHLFLSPVHFDTSYSTSHLLRNTASVERAALSSLYVPFICSFLWFLC